MTEPSWSQTIEAVRAQLAAALSDAAHGGQTFLPSGWISDVRALWNAQDLPRTEELLRQLLAARASGHRDPRDVVYAGGLWTVDNLLVRVLFEQGRYEETLSALDGVLEMGAPYWLLQIMHLATARLEAITGRTDVAVERYRRTVEVPIGGLSDPDYVLQGLSELETLSVPGASRTAPAAEWARIALWFASRVGDGTGLR